MIDRIYAKNYRAFKELDVPLSKINLFFGPNNSGKSSIMSLINLLSQTLLSSDDTVRLLLRGSKEDLGTYRDVIYKNEIKNPLIIGIESRPTLRRSYQLGFRKDIQKLKGSIELEYNYKSRRHEVVLKHINTDIPEAGIRIQIKKTKTGKNYQVTSLELEGKIIPYNKWIRIFEHFLPAIWEISYNIEKGREFYQKMHISRLFYFNFIEEMKKIEFVGPFRVPPSRTYLFSGEGPDSVGVHGERAIDIMTIDNLKRSKDKRDIVKKTSEWFKKCGISDELGINPLTDRHFEVFLSQMGLKENIADTGYGCSQVLPILVAGYNLKEGDILVVQEPEIHLHPRAQAELGTFFYELSKQGIQTMIETHSEHMLLRLQAHIADKKSNLKPEDINVYYIYVDDDKRIIRKLELKNDGFFKYDWPQGFFPERYNEAKKIAKASLEG